MNAKLWICAAGAAISALACTREVVEQDIETTTNEIELTASWAQDDESGSRTALQENGTSIWWTTGEEINAFFGTMASGKFTSTNTEPQATANFTGTLTSLIGDIDTEEGNAVCWAIYPYNEANTCDGQSVTMTLAHEQEAVASTFADKFFPAVAKSNSFSLAFYNVCGGVRFSVTQEGVKRVIFKSNDGSPMAGKVRVGFGEDNRPQILEIVEAVDHIVVLAPESGSFTPGTYYFAALLPQTHAEGIEVKLQTIGNKEASKLLDNSITVHRSAFGLLNDVDDGLGYNYIKPELVDLGLSVKWASFNLGASIPEEFGEYFAWGETKPKKNYEWSTYKWCNGTTRKMTKYCVEARYGDNGFTDNKTVLEPNDDAACKLLGGKWRMPTRSEFEELVSNCSFQIVNHNGVRGVKITSKKTNYTDKWIFLPNAGFAEGTTIPDLPGMNYNNMNGSGYYWSSSLCLIISSYAYYLRPNDIGYEHNDYRYRGYTIRPVYDD